MDYLRLGHYGSAVVYDGAELKAVQEVRTLNHVVRSGLIALGAFFVFKRPFDNWRFG